MKKSFLVGVVSLLVFLISCNARKNAAKESPSGPSYYSLVEVTIKIIAPKDMSEEMRAMLAKATNGGAFKIECPKRDSLHVGDIVTTATLALHISNNIHEPDGFFGWAMVYGIPLEEIQGPYGHFYQGVITDIRPWDGR
jgi:hypothetical protein